MEQLFPIQDHQAATRLANFFEVILAHVAGTQESISDIVGWLNSNPRFQRILDNYPAVDQQFREVTTHGRRSRDALILATSAQENTRAEVGQEFYDLYLSHIPARKNPWDVLRRLFSWARTNNISAIVALRMAYYETLARLRETKQGSSKLKGITMADFQKIEHAFNKNKIRDRSITVKDLPAESRGYGTIWLDRNSIPWFDLTPDERLNPNATAPNVQALDWTATDPAMLRKRKRDAKAAKKRTMGYGSNSDSNASVTTPTKKSKKSTKKHPAEKEVDVDPANDPFTGTNPNRPNIVSKETKDPQTGAITITTQSIPIGTPVRSLARLHAQWKPGGFPDIPIVPVNPPKYQEWYNWNDLSDLEYALLNMYCLYMEWLARRRNNPPYPWQNQAIRSATTEDIQEALTSLRRRVDFTQPPDGQSPYQDPRNDQFFFMLGLTQWLAGHLFAEEIRDESWVSVARGMLQDLRQFTPPGDFNVVRVAPGATMRTQSFEANIWLVDSTGRYQG